jgi:hypothetical protein
VTVLALGLPTQYSTSTPSTTSLVRTATGFGHRARCAGDGADADYDRHIQEAIGARPCHRRSHRPCAIRLSRWCDAKLLLCAEI